MKFVCFVMRCFVFRDSIVEYADYIYRSCWFVSLLIWMKFYWKLLYLSSRDSIYFYRYFAFSIS